MNSIDEIIQQYGHHNRWKGVKGMTPSQIKPEKSYKDRQGRIYDVIDIVKEKSRKMVRFRRREPDPGTGKWKIDIFAEHMKEEVKQ